jgi:hypothetical protein
VLSGLSVLSVRIISVVSQDYQCCQSGLSVLSGLSELSGDYQGLGIPRDFVAGLASLRSLPYLSRSCARLCVCDCVTVTLLILLTHAPCRIPYSLFRHTTNPSIPLLPTRLLRRIPHSLTLLTYAPASQSPLFSLSSTSGTDRWTSRCNKPYNSYNLDYNNNPNNS